MENEKNMNFQNEYDENIRNADGVNIESGRKAATSQLKERRPASPQRRQAVRPAGAGAMNQVKRKKKKKSGIASRIFSAILIVFVLALVAGSVVAYKMWAEYTHTESDGEIVEVFIPEGSSGADIARILKEHEVINYEFAFKMKLKKSPYSDKLNPGKFTLKKDMPYNEIIDVLRGIALHKEGISVTIPEGYSAEMIAALFEKKGFCTSDEFLKELSEGEFEYDFIKEIPDNPAVKYKLQGYLFPSTHSFDKDADAHTIINTLLAEFEKQYYGVLGDQPAKMPLNEVITRASLIEREAKLDSERQTISGVIQNRLDADMLLQIDAAVVYAISDGKYDVDRVLYSDLKVDSPYNTYMHKGLPPGAICNPGIESIIGAMYPEEHNYLYYHTDEEKNDGSHIFSETFNEHKN